MALELGILVADPSLIGVAVELVRASGAPIGAALFLMDDGVHAAADPRVGALLDGGTDVTLCAMDAEARGLSPTDGGVRFGSQYDHALLVRDSQRFVALTGARIDDHSPTRSEDRTVAVRVTRDSRHAKTAQALRAAVGYAAGGLKVVVLVEPLARGLLSHDDHPGAVQRALTTLRGLGLPLVGTAHNARPPSVSLDLEVTW
jgi:hypothetical protein